MPGPELKNNQIFWVDVDTISPNPYQPRKEFDEAALRDLADSIRQYGILQPVTITEAGQMDDGRTKYELIAGERRTRASRIAGLQQIPAVIRVGDDDKSRFELAIIENLQREDLNPIERAKAFLRLAEEFSLTHAQIGKKMGKSRAYVSNSLRLLSLPPEIKEALGQNKISEGHTRPLMMLEDRPEEQMTLFKEIMYKKMSVRESEKIARKIAHEKVRKEKYKQDPQVAAIEKEFSETLGTRVSIEKGEVGGKIVIDYFSPDDLGEILSILKHEGEGKKAPNELLERFAKSFAQSIPADESPARADGGQVSNSHDSLTPPMATPPKPPVAFASRIPDDTEHHHIDDTELDIVADPRQELPPAYYRVFDIPADTAREEDFSGFGI